MAGAGRLLLLLCLLPGSLAWGSKAALHLYKVPFRQPNNHACSKHSDCQSGCCVANIYSSVSEMTCRPRTIFLQCEPWRKRNGSHCTSHEECQSRCCIKLNKVSRHRCVPQSGILAQCLPLGSAGHGGGSGRRVNAGFLGVRIRRDRDTRPRRGTARPSRPLCAVKTRIRGLDDVTGPRKGRSGGHLGARAAGDPQTVSQLRMRRCGPGRVQ
ncbi:leucine-rich colipase-like protein 1, partial [Hyaena hyaena]|uniref:leucine-rich colipase-like protein 1 n=1 Tax=Hyaena hyaena TaxID=95912 RepID=UPI001922D0C7